MIHRKTMFAAIPLVLLAVAATGQVGIVKAWDGYWGGWNGGGWSGYHWGVGGYGYGYWQARQARRAVVTLSEDINGRKSTISCNVGNLELRYFHTSTSFLC
ncbi:MAG: hypothetical protein WBZ36_19690 [Candidatus Nitrosopolaris sp.]